MRRSRLLLSVVLGLLFALLLVVSVSAYWQQESLGVPDSLTNTFGPAACSYDVCGVAVLSGSVEMASIDMTYGYPPFGYDAITVAYALDCVGDPGVFEVYFYYPGEGFMPEGAAYSLPFSGPVEGSFFYPSYSTGTPLTYSVSPGWGAVGLLTCTIGIDYPYQMVEYPERVPWTWVTDNISGTDSLTLNWDDVGADSYDVYRGGVKVATDTVGTSFVDSGLTTGESYGYQVYSKLASGTQTPGVYQVFTQGAGDSSSSMPALSLAATTSALYDLGLLPVISLAALVFVAFLLYRRFRKTRVPQPYGADHWDSYRAYRDYQKYS